jgi:hypothetical protein
VRYLEVWQYPSAHPGLHRGLTSVAYLIYLYQLDLMIDSCPVFVANELEEPVTRSSTTPNANVELLPGCLRIFSVWEAITVIRHSDD